MPELASSKTAPLTPGEAAEMLRRTPAALRTALAALPDRLLAWHPAPGAWCAKAVVGHLVEAERHDFAGRVRAILHEPEPRLAASDQEQLARGRRDCGRDIADLIAELAEVREASVALVAGLAEPDLRRGGYHPTIGHVRVGGLIHEWVSHDSNHIRQALAKLQAFVWPHIGNTRRFYQE